DQGAPPALAPDGSAIVFGASDELWYRSLRAGTERALPGTHSATFPFWSPDSSAIGFFADAKLKTLDIDSAVVPSLFDPPPPRAAGRWERATSSFFLLRSAMLSIGSRRAAVPQLQLRIWIPNSTLPTDGHSFFPTASIFSISQPTILIRKPNRTVFISPPSTE